MSRRLVASFLVVVSLATVGVACRRHRGDPNHPDEKSAKDKKKKKDATDDAPTTSASVASASAPAKDDRHFTFNQRPATDRDLETVARIERMYDGKPVPSGDYWYDAKCGAAGIWGGPTLGFLPPDLELGAPLPPNASGGGDGKTTGVFINGRELHPIDVKVLMNVYGQAPKGRWWVDGDGNAGKEGGPKLVNLVILAKQRAAQGKGDGAAHYYRSDGLGNNAFVGGGCVSVSGKSGSTSYDYIGSGC